MAERRRRKRRFGGDKQEITSRVLRFYDDDLRSRDVNRDSRLQRYAKYRLWTEGKDWPWPDACFSLDTELLTEEGWRLVGEVEVGDCVYTRTRTGRAEYRPVAALNRTETREAVAFCGKSIDLLVTQNHRMLVHDWAGRQKFVCARDFVGLPNKAWSIPLTSDWRGACPTHISGLPATAYMRLLGWYISEGSQNTGGTLGIAQGDANPENCATIEADLAAAQITWKRHGSTYSLHSKGMAVAFKEEFRAFGRCDEKVLPGHVLGLSSDLLEELLDTLMRGDGHVFTNGHREYYTTSKALADQVQIIAQKLRVRATVSLKKQQLGGQIRGRQIVGVKPLYVVSINRKPTIQVRKMSVEFVSFGMPQEFACVNVPPHHTLYVRRNGKAVWCGNSDIPLPDMTEKSLRMQDTLYNAMLVERPTITPKAMVQQDSERETEIAELLDFQFFSEASGETLIGDAADQFVNDPAVTIFIPWVREEAPTTETRIFDPIPPELPPQVYFEGLVQQLFATRQFEPGEGGWDFKVVGGDGLDPHNLIRVRFYTRKDDSIEMEIRRTTIVHDGPAPIVMEYDDVLYPARAANLQAPGPSNPNGASHVILRSFPDVDEIRRLKRNGFYDRMTGEDLEKLEGLSRSGTDEEEKRQKDAFAGKSDEKFRSDVQSHTKLTRLVCFDRFDIDGDGLDEDVIFWVLKESKTLLKVARLGVQYPMIPPRRPLASGSFLPVAARNDGISLLEMLEGLHDASKALIDQSVDSGTIANSPFGFYRATSTMNPETIRMLPGDLYPLGDPNRDVTFPTIGNPQAQGFNLNMLTILGQMQERVSVIGDLQFGRVPPGKSTALRTVGGMALLTGQGEARPERILRRFLGIWTEVFAQMHELNQHFLPKGKQFRIMGYRSEADDPYRVIEDPAQELRGRFTFMFGANVLNVSKQGMQQSLQAIMSVYISGLSLQLGIMTPDGLYRLLRDFGQAFGQDPDKYLSPPSPDSLEPKITAEQAIHAILSGRSPDGVPAEGAAAHLARLQQFIREDTFVNAQTGQDQPSMTLLTPQQLDTFRGYVQKVVERTGLDQRRAAAAQSADQLGQGGGQPGRPPEGGAPSMENPPLSGGNELIDESLPTAGGGGNGSQR